MKKLLGILVLGLLWCNVGFADTKLIKTDHLRPTEDTSFYISTICVDGYKFVATGEKIGTPGEGYSIVQFFERAGGQSLPARCE